MKSILTLFSSLIFTLPVLAATPLKQLREQIPAGTKETIGSSTVIEGIVVSDKAGRNSALNPNLSFDMVDMTMSERTVYIQTPGGEEGVKVIFRVPEDNTLRRWDHIQLDIAGATVEHISTPDCMVISGIGEKNILSATGGSMSDITPKMRTIGTLTDRDLYTYTTLADIDFVNKEGSYINIYEGYAQLSRIHTGDYADKVNNRMDGWANLLRDAEGNTIYMMVNTLCQWRKNGRHIPQGTGPVSGIIVHEEMRRYGGDMGRYSIRPVDENDIAIIRKKNTPWKCLTGWILDGSAGQELEFELLGVQGGVWKNGKKGDRLVNDSGSTRGFFWTDSDSFIHIDSDLTYLDGEKNGYDINGAIFFKGPSVSWYTYDADGKVNGTHAFYVEFSPAKAKGSMMEFNFSWCAGNQDANYCWAYPAEWKVECSIDGSPWTLLRETATGASKINLRSLPWWDRKIDGLGSRMTSFDCGLGMQTRSFALPSSVFGKNKVLLRLSPASDQYVKPHTDPQADVVGGASMTRDMDFAKSWIRFGSLSVDYK